MARDRQLGNLSVRLRADITQYLSMMEKAGAATEKTQSQMAISAEKMTTVFAGATTAIVGFATASIKAAIDWGTAIEDLSDKTGMSGEEASKFLVLAKRTGMDMEKAQIIWGKFSKAVYASADAMGKAAAEGKESDDVLTRLGIAAQNTDGSMRSTLEIFTDVKNRLQQMDNGWQKTALEMELFGKSGTDVHDVLMMSNEEMTKTIDRATKLGLVMGNELSAGWKQLKLNFNETQQSMEALGIGIGNELLPKMTESLQKAQDLTAAFIAWKAANPALAESIGEVAVALGKVVFAAKALQLVGLKSPWIIPILAFGAAVDFQASRERGPGQSDAEREAAEYGFDLAGPSKFGMGGLRTAESKMTIGNKKPPADEFLGGKGGGGDKGKTALESFLELQRNEMQIIEKKRELRQITDQEYYSQLHAQRTELEAVVAAADEEFKKRVAILDIDIKIMQEDKKRADLSKKLILQQYADNEKAVNDRLKLHGDVYSKELEMEELQKGSKRAYLAWLLAESKKFNDQKSTMDDYQFLEESQREALRREAIKKTNEEIAKENIRAAEASKEAWVDALTGVVTGTRDASDVLKQIWQELVNNIIRQLFGLEAKAGGLLGGIFGNSSGGGNWLGSIFGGLFGGGGGGNVGPQLTYDSSGMFLVPKFADGGIPPANRMSIVGEAGPELFIPGRTGRVVSNDELSGLSGGKGDVYINPTFQSLDPATNMKLFKEQLPMIKSEIRAAMVNEPSMRTAVRSAAK